MSRKLLAFLLSELGTVRILCHAPGCGAVAEMSLAKLAADATNPRCKFCLAEFDPAGTGENPFQKFALAAEELKRLAKLVDLEFVLPDPSD